ncbi:DNA polymerase III subunit chi [Varunaivibrio sulfuroxidans]|uniref:DNA polymerase III chi subunit n=1 Tax=Varunaivibrio sulfuroxidans TaxID=1773489 RepID=A0A4R3J536_9PROT|nr:DNA polymerase III subunit chi [Varunaivibrio sulfuroxidans]TCS60382.1 DNA polymerase III chi subunit [Varunaivibrio sulfuroxidans]WES30931.1 DNA polymerase III subunit chi [Varunaivibrio sulfuroxidans]
MTDIAFYHLQHTPLETVLPKLLEKTLQAGERALVLAASGERVEHLCAALWTYDPASWLPHGTDKDGHGARQPVWLSCADENVNSASFLFLTDGATSQRSGEFERCFYIFDGHDPEQLARARTQWKRYLEDGHVLTYWQQDVGGGWAKKG